MAKRKTKAKKKEIKSKKTLGYQLAPISLSDEFASKKEKETSWDKMFAYSPRLIASDLKKTLAITAIVLAVLLFIVFYTN